MTDHHLGKPVAFPERYSPELLVPIPRRTGRDKLGLDSDALPFAGYDLWQAWELSWLGPENLPRAATGRIVVSADSPNVIESKSLKLYLNSLNMERYDSDEAVRRLIERDLADHVGAAVEVVLHEPEREREIIASPGGIRLEDRTVTIDAFTVNPGLLTPADAGGERSGETLYTHLFRANCPITGQPDWATVAITYSGRAISRAGLLQYLVSYRGHNDYHENCVERIFCDIRERCEPRELTVQASFLRRGGLDINPLRTTSVAPDFRAFPRLGRQ